MKRCVAFFLVLICVLSVSACRKTTLARTVEDVPEDFSFALTWGNSAYHSSSYDSQTGTLIKVLDPDVDKPEDYVGSYHLSDDEKVYFYNLIARLDWESYPDQYDPHHDVIPPQETMSLILTIRCNGVEKTIRAEGIAPSYEAFDKKGQDFLSVCEMIRERLTATDEWAALPTIHYL